jgi:dual oxidase
MGMASQFCEREDHIITPDLRGFVFGPLEASRRDLMAINIQRGREHGLPSYNVARRHFHLPEATHFENITSNQAVADSLKSVYSNDIDKLDIWPGGLAETEDNQGPGPLFSAVISDQFGRIRDGDRFWYENTENGLFTDEEIDIINNTTMRQILLAVGRGVITEDAIGENPFQFQEGDPCPTPYQPGTKFADPEDERNLEPCTPPQTYDYYGLSWKRKMLPLVIALGFGSTVVISIVVMMYFVRKGNMQRASLHAAAGHIERTTLSKRNKATSKRVELTAQVIRDELLQADDEFVDVADTPAHAQDLLKTRIRTHGFLTQSSNEICYIDIEKRVQQSKIVPQVVVYDTNGDVALSIGCADVQLIHAGPLYRHVVVECRTGTGCYLQFDAMSGAKFTVLLDRAMPTGVTPPQLIVYATEDEVLAQSERITKTSTERISRAINSGLQHIVQGLPGDWRVPFAAGCGDNCQATEIRLSVFEFAGMLGLPTDHDFVEALFAFADGNGDGFLSAEELMQVMVPLSTRDKVKRADLFFDFYDKNGNGTLEREELGDFTAALYVLTGLEPLDDEQTEQHINGMLEIAQLPRSLTSINKAQFRQVMEMQADLQNALDQLVPGSTSKKDATIAPSERGNHDVDRKHVIVQWSSWIQSNRLDIFWTLVFFGITGMVFYERFWFYSVVRLQGGLKGIAGYGVATTRGGASAMMWCFSVLLLPLCRNTLTVLRGTFVSKIINLDSNIQFHKLAASTGFLFVLVHLVGHSINFYNISTQPASDVGCLFRNVFWRSDFLPSFAWWVFETVTGMSGFLLTLVTLVMFTFSIPYSRRGSFQVFWMVHHLWTAFYFFLYLHGAARIVQQPILYHYNLGPLLLFVVDKLISFSRSHHSLKIENAALLPSGVTALQMEKPPGFEDMKSGQWLRIKCAAVSGNEWHPFTISSAPQEEFVSVHIRTAGPWTGKLRQVISARISSGEEFPNCQIEGPFGEIHQDWLHSRCCVFVGGGIGVTPFASILQDLAWRYRNGQKVKPERIFFIWVTRTQKEYEWMVELLKEVQEEIPSEVLSVYIYITQGKKQYDVRTALMFMFERNQVQSTEVSLLTGVRAITNFKRPDMFKVLHNIRDETPNMPITIYTCGPPPLAGAVDSGTNDVNSLEDTVYPLTHHYVSF